MPLRFEEGMSNVRDLIPMICIRREKGYIRSVSMREGKDG